MNNLRIMKLEEIPSFFASRMDGDLEIYVSSEAMEYLRDNADRIPCPVTPPRKLTFKISEVPYRYEDAGTIVYPKEDYSDVLRPAWINATLEAVQAVGGGCSWFVLYERKPYSL